MNQILRYFLKFLIILITPPGIYLFLALIGSVIPVNTSSKNDTAYIEIYLYKQGMHTDILLPVKSEIIEWDSIFRPDHTLAKPKKPALIGFGWGDLKFYRNTPQWEDLKFQVAFTALFLKSQSAMHARFYQKAPVSENLIKIEVTKDQFRRLSEYILKTVNKENTQEIEPVANLNYYDDDAFYLAETSFSLFKTCNTWTNTALKSAGLRACLWTPFPQGIFYQYR